MNAKLKDALIIANDFLGDGESFNTIRAALLQGEADHQRLERYEKAIGLEIDAHAKLAETTYTKNGKERFACGQVVGVLTKIRDYAEKEETK